MESINKNIEEGLRYIIERTTWIRETKAIVTKEENIISTPLVDDLSKIDDVHSIFVTYSKGRKMIMRRKQFIFIILYFFSPSTLGGFKMRRGLRKKIADLLHCTCSNVSHDYKDISFYYLNYRNFRTSVNEIIEKALADLKIKKEGV